MGIMLSVCIVAYNHEKYIAQAIESVLAQKVNFPIEIVIGDDKGTDRTRNICVSYKEKYPDIIKLRLPDKNIGMTMNVVENLEACTGKYMAFLEGDDYWTDPLKLQKQVDFLETHPDYALCYHHVQVIQDGDFNNRKLEMKRNQPETSTIDAILQKSIWAHLNSIVYRREQLLKCPDWFIHCPSLDWALLALITGDKKIKYLDESMSVYRQHGGGIWSSNTKIKVYENTLQTAKILNKYIVKNGNKKDIYLPVNSAYKALIDYYKTNKPVKAVRYFLLSKLLNFNYAVNIRKEATKNLTGKELFGKIIKSLKRRLTLIVL